MMPRYRCFLFALVPMMLAACSPVKRINPPTASIQQLSVLADGRWQMDVRLQNFSNVGMHYAMFNAELELAGVPAGVVSVKADMDIPGESADIVQAFLVPSANGSETLTKAGKAGIFYAIKGEISISDPKRDFKFEYKSRLTPAPGLDNVYR